MTQIQGTGIEGTSIGGTGGEVAGAVAAPLLTVVRGEPTPEQLAALVAVLAARSAGGDPEPVAAPSLWSAPQLRQPLHPGPGAWRASSLPL